MTSSDTHSTPDEPPPSSGDDSEESGDDQRGEYGLLAVSIVASAVLHFVAVGGVPYVANLLFDVNANIEWLNTTDELTGLGHRVRNRFAELDESSTSDDEPQPEESSSPASPGPTLDDEALEKALDGSYDPPDPPDPKPEPSPSAERQANADRQTEAERREPNEPSTRSPDPSSNEQTKSASDDEKPSPFSNIGSHTALDRQGPNDLPDMRSFAPGNARMSALIRVDQIRGKPYAGIVKKILRAVPDYRLLLGNPNIDPVEDMDWFFMASPNPRYIEHTFLAVRHRLDNDRLVDLLDARYPNSPPWQTYEHLPVRDLVPDNPHYRDPRRIVLPGDGLAVVAKNKLLDDIAGPLSRDSELLRAQNADGDPAGSGAPTERGAEDRPTLLDGLVRLHSVARRDDTIVLMSARGLTLALPGVGRLPPFESARLAVTRPDHPTLDIDLQFKNERRARDFEQSCPSLRTAIDDAIPFSGTIGLSSLLEELDCRADGTFVNVHGEFTAAEIANLGEWLYPFVPRPPVLEELPEPPKERKGERRKDAGVQKKTSPDAGSKKTD